MTVLSGQTIRELKPFFPWSERTVFDGMSYGLSYAGYDVRIAETRWVWKLLPMRLASTIERFVMPLDCLAIIHDKSTWVRRGVFVHNTVAEPGWEGYLTLEISCNSWIPRRIRAGSPIAQVILHRVDKQPERAYAGKYQHQEQGPQRARREEVPDHYHSQAERDWDNYTCPVCGVRGMGWQQCSFGGCPDGRGPSA